MSPKSLANLRPFQKGKSGNPGGLPKGVVSMAYAIRATATKDRVMAVVNRLWDEAKAGNIRAAEILLERLEGKVKETHEHDGSLTLKWVEEIIANSSDATRD